MTIRELLVHLDVVEGSPPEGVPDWFDIVIFTVDAEEVVHVDDDD